MTAQKCVQISVVSGGVPPRERHVQLVSYISLCNRERHVPQLVSYISLMQQREGHAPQLSLTSA